MTFDRIAPEQRQFACVRAEVLGHGGAVGATERQALANKMDAISEDWVRLRLAVCNDYNKRHLVSEYQQQVKCFDERLDQQRKLVTVLKGSDTSAAEKLAASLVEAPGACK